MTCYKNPTRLLLVACFGLDGMLALAGCGGIKSKQSPIADASTADSIPVADVAIGSLTFTPHAPSFASTWQVGESSNAQTLVSVVSLSRDNVTITLENLSTTTDYGPVELSLGGTHADQFLIVRDACSALTLQHGGGEDAGCLVSLAFLPTSAGQKTAELTASAGAETARVTITGAAVSAVDITITPDQHVEGNDNVHDFGTVPQMHDGAWTAFTIANPSGAPRSARVSFGLGKESDPAYKLADGTNHAFGTCGSSGLATLAPGTSCTFWVQFMPELDQPVGNPEPLIGWIQATDEAKGKSVGVKGAGRTSSIVTISPSTYTFPDTPIDTTSVIATLTVTNHGSALLTLGLPSNDALAPFRVDQDSGCAQEPRVLVGGASCPLVVDYVSQGIHVGLVKDKKLVVSATNAENARATSLLTGTTARPARLQPVGYDNSPEQVETTINLGAVRVGSRSGDVTLVFKNAGTLPTSSLDYQWGTAQPNTPDAEFVIVDDGTEGCAGRPSLAAGATCTVTIHFRPIGAEGLRGPTRFTLSAATGGTVQIFKLQGFALAPDASAWIGTAADVVGFYSFPGMTASTSTTSPHQIFQLTNHTSTSVPPALRITGGDTSSFALVETGTDAGNVPCGELPRLDPGGSCTFAVAFTPATWSLTSVYRHAVVTATGFVAAPPELGVYGRVQSPALLTITPAVTPAFDPFNFGRVVVNTEARKTFTVTNTGESMSGPITLWRVGNERFTFPAVCSDDLAPGASCMASITFSAGTTAGTHMAEFGAHFAMADGQTGGSYSSLANAEIVYDTTLTVSPASLAFPSQPVGTVSPLQLLTLHNATDALPSGLLTIALADPTSFSLVGTDDCPVATNSTYAEGLAMGASCEVAVAFTPQTLGTGAVATDLTISASPGSTQTVHLTGTAVTAMHIRPEQPGPLSLAHSMRSPFRLTAWLEPKAPTTSYVRTSLSGNGYRIVEDQCVATKLSGGDSCEIWIAYLGSDTPLPSATLTVDGGAAGNRATLILNGTIPPAP